MSEDPTDAADGAGDPGTLVPEGSALTAVWRPTAAHVRAVVVALALLGIGVVMRRPDAVALGAPLAVVAVWSHLRRPEVAPVVHAWLRHGVLREGQTTAWTATVEPGPGVEEVALAVTETEFTRYTPASQCVAAGDVGDGGVGNVGDSGPAATRLDVFCQSTRWGLRRLGPATCAVTGAFGAHVWEPAPVHAPLVPTVPLPEAFSARTPAPDPDGLVGRSRSRHHGDGSELADVRGFRFGDRLRRIHWPVSVRTGELHVTTTYADEDSEILLLVDAMQDLGRSSGFDGEGSSLDNGVRAAAAVAEHYLRAGDRVGLQVLGAHQSPRLSPGLGTNQLRRLLDVLARVRVADGGVVDEKRLRGQLLHPVSAGTLVVFLTPAVSVSVLAHAAQLSRRGTSTIVVDTLPRAMATGDLTDEQLAGLVPEQSGSASARLAWRLRLLERSREVSRTRLAGVPIVPWVGPGTLDLVMRDIAKQRRSPRVVTR
ncbi:hypothetical protein N798_12275 [Knoellia flava TL1]|uniref:DUF58 domain-containing protein n=2 Tax=Knoellia flava TaxID=913969 RepID=A0A8H9FSC6_9MICO|nr:DUF58 domain-containing protein [Knoellia flava]KGN29899.1 hypothetical protein N798_12275 [Knoellia flava TL1]GGB70535.1 hypothetical protein GCM10011314_07320 [Knoellia flava]